MNISRVPPPPLPPSPPPPPATAFGDDDDAALFAGEEWGEEKSALDILREKAAKKALPAVDHSAIDYAPFEKSFYRAHADVAALPAERVAALREDLEVKLRGREPIPAPVATWEHTGLPDRILALLASRGFAAPFAVQQQALPIIMSGRDLLGVARTGSGKTLAYLLPLLRQVLDQPPLEEGEGPIGLILAPSRELVVQVGKTCTRAAARACKHTLAHLTPHTHPPPPPLRRFTTKRAACASRWALPSPPCTAARPLRSRLAC